MMFSTLSVLNTLPVGEPSSFPCVDCGLLTGNFCDGGDAVGYDRCFSSERVPKDYPPEVYGNRRTPLCSYCEARFGTCRFCRGVPSCTPLEMSRHWSGIPLAESRSFTEAKALAVLKELEVQGNSAGDKR